jgi:hypothetical protein
MPMDGTSLGGESFAAFGYGDGGGRLEPLGYAGYGGGGEAFGPALSSLQIESSGESLEHRPYALLPPADTSTPSGPSQLFVKTLTGMNLLQ